MEAVGLLIILPGRLFFIAVGVLIGALVLRFATGKVMDFKPAYLRSCGVVLAAAVAGFIVSVVLQAAMVMSGQVGILVAVVCFVANFIVSSAVYGFLIKRTDSTSIGFKNGCYIALVIIVFWIVIAVLFVILALVLGMIFGAASQVG